MRKYVDFVEKYVKFLQSIWILRMYIDFLESKSILRKYVDFCGKLYVDFQKVCRSH